MNMAKRKELLEGVLDSFVASGSGPSHAALTEWIRRYPHFERDLTDFVVDWSLMRHLPPSSETEEVDEKTLVLRAMSIVENKLHAIGKRERLEESGASGLLAEGRRRGMSLAQIAKRCNLSEGIVRMLDLRLIDPASVHPRVTEQVYRALGASAEYVAALLQGPMRPAAGAYYRATKSPKLPGKQMNFFDAVRADREMDEEQRAYWLALEKSKG